MPTLECLDERSKNILDRLDSIEGQIKESHRQFLLALEHRDAQLTTDITEIRRDVDVLKLQRVAEEGTRKGAVWAGGLALTAFAAIVGAVGNTIWAWAIGPHGPLNK